MGLSGFNESSKMHFKLRGFSRLYEYLCSWRIQWQTFKLGRKVQRVTREMGGAGADERRSFHAFVHHCVSVIKVLIIKTNMVDSLEARRKARQARFGLEAPTTFQPTVKDVRGDTKFESVEQVEAEVSVRFLVPRLSK